MPAAALLELDDPRRGRLVVRSGETVVLLGASGAGKTELIRALLFPGVLEQAPGVEAALLVTASAGERAWAADSVALVADGRLVAQAPLAELIHSRAPDVRAVLAWVIPASA